MGAFIDLTGNRYHSLTVVRKTDKRASGSVVWECKCDCGSTTYVSAGHLKNGHTKSCGCHDSENIIGNKYGRLTVISGSNKRTDSGDKYWLCICECGNTKNIIGYNIKNGTTKSCGCLQKESAAETYAKGIIGKKFGRLLAIEKTNKRYNNLVVYKCICECGNATTATSHALLYGVKRSCGCLAKENIAKIVKETDPQHHGCYKGTKISALSCKTHNTNTSGYKGVCFVNGKQKYMAYIIFKGKQRFLGYYDNPKDAYKARKLAEEKLFHPIIEEYNQEMAVSK